MGSELHLIALFMAIGSELNSLWQFFLSVHLALVASLYGIDRLSHLKKIDLFLLGTGYFMFTFINLRAKQPAILNTNNNYS